MLNQIQLKRYAELSGYTEKALARVVVVGVVVAPVAEPHAVGVDAHEGFGLRDDGFIFVFALARPFVP